MFRNLPKATFFCVVTLLVSFFTGNVSFGQLLQDVMAAPTLDVSDSEGKETEEDEKSETQEKINPFFENLVPPDRNVMRRYDQAVRLIQADRIAEAAQLLGAILESSTDFFVLPRANEKGEEEQRTIQRTFFDLILEKLQGLPTKGKESYSLQFETQARRLLEKAVEQGSIEGLQRVAKNYFPTSSGGLATLLIGLDQFEKGDWEAAMLTLQRLETTRPRQQADLYSYEPALSLTLASCQLRAKNEPEARKTIDRFFQRFSNPEMLLAGKEPWKPQSTDEILNELKRSLNVSQTISTANWMEQSGWRLSWGNATQNPQTQAEFPLLDYLWAVPSTGTSFIVPQVNLLLRHVRQAEDTYIPALQPILVDNTLVLRDLGSVTGIDIRTGKRIWHAKEPELKIRHGIQAPYIRMPFHQLLTMPNTQYRQFGLRIFFWHDRLSHQMSSDGKQLFLVEGLDPMPLTAFGPWGGGRRPVMVGNKRTEDPRYQAGSTLTARDLKTGRILWQIGKFPYAQKVFDRLGAEYEDIVQKKHRKIKEQDKQEADNEADKQKPEDDILSTRNGDFSEEDIFLSETWFHGAPLPLLGRLYVIGENAGVLRLIALDMQTGKLLSQQPLIQTQTPFETDWLRRYYGLTPAASGGILICQTALGMIVALDAGTLSPLWCFSYAQLPDENENLRNQLQNNQFFQYEKSGSNEEFRQIFGKTGWQVPCAMIDSGRVLVAPPDHPGLYCLDLATGELLWKNEKFNRLNVLYVACIHQGSAYIVTPVSMLSLSMTDGRPNWEFVLKEQMDPTSKHPQKIPTALRVIKKDLLEPLDKRSDSPEDQSKQVKFKLPKLVFPKSLRPVGTGIRNDGKYFLPLSNACLGIVNLDTGEMELISSASFSGKPIDSDDLSGVAYLPDFNVSEASNLVSKNLSLGNMIGLQGKFYSQSPTNLLCFDQWEILKKSTANAWKNNPNDPQTLIQTGRIHQAEGNIEKAIAAFRRSMEIQPSELASDYLRRILLQAVQNDYSTWSSSAKELENLAEFPEELGEILFVLAQGAVQQGHTKEFVDLLKKALRLELDYSVGIATEPNLILQLHRALGRLIEQGYRSSASSSEQTDFDNELNRVAETLFEQFNSNKRLEDILPKPHFYEASRWITQQLLVQPWWEQDSLTSLGDIRRWRLFNELFQSLPISERSKKILQEQYEKNRLFVSLEMILNPPNDRKLPAPADVEKPLSLLPSLAESIPEKASEETASARLAKHPIPETFKRRSLWPQYDVLERLANLLETRKNISDAYYYYEMISRHYGEKGVEAFRQALEKPELKQFYRDGILPLNWPRGETKFFDGESKPDTTNVEQKNPHGWAATRILRQVQARNRSVGNQAGVPYSGPFEPFISPYRYAMEASYPSTSALVCYDALGEERWRYNLSHLFPDLSDYGYFSDNNAHYKQGFVPQQVYVKGCNHLLLFVRGNMLIALDIFEATPEEEPKFLWSKKLTTGITTRQMFSAMPLHRLLVSGSQGPWAFPTEALFVSSRIVCFRDGDNIYGLDPSTGQTLWSRSCNSSSCSFFGDRDHLFCVFPESASVQAVDPENGYILAEGTIPGGVVFSYETKLVFLTQHKTQNGPIRNPIQISFVDLRDLLDLALRNNSKEQQDSGNRMNSDRKCELISLPAYTIRDGLSSNSQVRPVLDDQVLATLSWESKTLQLYDLADQKDLLGPMGDWQRRQGVKLPLSHLKDVNPYDCDLDVELYGEKYLVQFVDLRRVDTTPKKLVEDGVPFQRHCNVVSNVACRSVGSGTLMLYEPDGTPCWKEPAKIKDWFRVQNTPTQSPVILYALSVTDQEKNKPPHDTTALLGIDKQTGGMRFSKQIPADKEQNHALLQGFQVSVVPKNQEIVFASPNRIIHAKFTGDPVSPESPGNKSDTPTTWKETVEINDFLQWFFK